MERATASQRNRNQNNPINLGVFSQTSLRYITGGLGPKWKLIGYKDTSFVSNGGVGGGTYNAWYQLEITSPAWLILVKGEPRPNYIQVSCYNLNKIPIESRMIWQEDSIQETNENNEQLTYFPYNNHVMGAGSNLYNTFSSRRVDKNNEQYFTLQKGKYLVCISSTRNEDIDYSLGLVVEFPDRGPFFMSCEDIESVLFEIENTIDFNNTLDVISPIQSDVTIGPDFNGFTDQVAEIQGSTTTVSIVSPSNTNNLPTWLISEGSRENVTEDVIVLDTVDGWTSSFHTHSLNEWRIAWERDHQQTNSFPEIFVPLTDSF